MYLNSVQTTITIAGKPCHFVHIRLHQTFNNHHTFEVKLDYQQLDIKWMHNPIEMVKLIGKDLNIVMQQIQTKESNLFKGIVTDVSMNGKHGEQNFITISGCSPTIRLDGTPTMDSFMDLDLRNIVKETVETSGNGAEVSIQPAFGGKIDYICQYDETAFRFLNRLSWLYGEWFYYDGTTIHFGKPDIDSPTVLTYDQDITEFDLRAKLIPPNVNRYEYLTHDVNEIKSASPTSVDGVRGYIKVALDESNKVYTSNAIRPLESSISSKKDLDDLVKVDKYRAVSQMLTMHATTQTCRVKIGKLVSIHLPDNMDVPLKHVETFLVTDVLHEIDQDGTYVNTFSAIPSEMENIPMEPVPTPKATSQIAWVKSNADSKGRVTVQTQWQKQLNKTTNWARVQTPDGGSSGDVANNRGFVFVPEEGDQVMVNYENGDPNRPYISGAIFPENVSTGGGSGNKTKSLTSRTGSTVTLDDSVGSITINDPSGNVIVMDGSGSMTITAPQDVVINGSSMSVNISGDVQWNIGGSETKTIAGTQTVSSEESNIDVKSDMNINVGSNQTTTVGSKLATASELTEHSSSGNYKIESGDNVEIKGSSEVKLT